MAGNDQETTWEGEPSGRRSVPPALWIVIAVVVVGVVIGVIIQANRSSSDSANSPDFASPAHVLGANNTEDLGDPEAPVVVEVYGDFQCPACAQFFETTQPTIDQLIIDRKILFLFGNFAFLGPESFRAASAALCAGDADVYWEYNKLLYRNQSEIENSGFLTADQLIAFGGETRIVGDELAEFERCVREVRYDGFVRHQTENAADKDVTGTPAVFINGELLENPTPARLDAAVDAAIAESG